MLTAFIDDGYTEETFLPEIDGISPVVNFTFRPMTAAQFSDYIQVQNRQTTTEAKAESAKRIQRHLQAWDIRNVKGDTIPLTAENILRLKQPVFTGLWEIVTCQRAGGANLAADSKN